MKSTQLLLSAIVLTKNEEKNIADCLQSVSFCDEIIIVDDNSVDKTLNIARKFKPRIFKRTLNQNFSKQRNFGLNKARGHWVLFVDADEVVSSILQKEIVNNLNGDIDYSGFIIHRTDVLWGKKLRYGEVGSFGGFGSGNLLRLGKRNKGLWERNIHEQWNIHGKIGHLNGELLHYPHQTVSEFISRIEKRAHIHANGLLADGKKPSFFKIIIWPLGKFIYNFVFRLGFLDGVEGFVLAIIMSFHSFIAWSYLWIHQK